MAEVLLFHHLLGQTEGFLAFADEVRKAGHVVHTPDLFDGRTFDSIEAGLAHAEQSGFGPLIDRGVAAAEELSNEVVYAGFSFGVLPAQRLAMTRAGAAGALLFESCVPLDEFGGTWPIGVAVQVHGMDDDPFFAHEGDIDAARALVEQASESASAELFVYPGDRHLFADSSLRSYDADAAATLMQRVLTFLEQVPDGR